MNVRELINLLLDEDGMTAEVLIGEDCPIPLLPVRVDYIRAGFVNIVTDKNFIVEGE